MPKKREPALPFGPQSEMALLIPEYDGDLAVFPERIEVDALEACGGKSLVFDTETNGLHWWKNEVIGIGVYCPEIDLKGYLPTTNPGVYERAQRVMRHWPAGTSITGHNLKFDFHMMRMEPYGAKWNLFDTTVMLHLIDSGRSKALRFAEKRWLKTESKVTFLNEGKTRKGKRVPIWEWPVAQVAKYCVNDCIVTWNLRKRVEVLLPLLGLDKLFAQQMEFLELVCRVEENGIPVDKKFCEGALAQLRPEIVELEKELYAKVGHTFDWRSSEQMSKALYEDFGWDRPHNPFEDADGVDRTRFAGHGGQYNKTLTTGFMLTEKAHHPLGGLVLTLREKDKLVLCFEQFLELCDQNGILHTVYNLTGTRTGRLSSSEPNLQNVPGDVRSRNLVQIVAAADLIRSDYQNPRLALHARPGHTLVSIDYKQMEMRMFGIISGDEKMQQALHSGVDIHSAVAQLTWGEVTKANREWSKTIGFGLIYGMSTGALQFRLGMTREQATKVCNQYFETFPRIKPWRQEIIQECRTNGFVRYWSGRIWREIDENKFYAGANAVIQGGCADILSTAGLRIQRKLDELGWGRLLLFVHDEIILEVPTERTIEAARIFASMMQVHDLFGFSFFVDVKVGRTYGSLEELSKEIWREDKRGTAELAQSDTGHAVAALPSGQGTGTSGLFGT